MNKTFSVFRLTDGIFTGQTYTVPEEDAVLNTLSGHALMDGTYDCLSYRVDIEKFNTEREAALSAHAEQVEVSRAAFQSNKALLAFGAKFVEPAFHFRATGEYIIDYVPTQPSADFEWNAQTKRWQLKPEVAQLNQRRVDAQAQINALELEQARPLRELMLDSDNAEARQRLDDIEAQIASLRPILA